MLSAKLWPSCLGLDVLTHSSQWCHMASCICLIIGPGCLLTHWGRVTHICVSKQTIIGSDNGLSPGRRQAIIWTNVGILLIWSLGTKFNENLIEIQTFSFRKMHLKMLSGKWRPFCLGLNVLISDLACSSLSHHSVIPKSSCHWYWAARPFSLIFSQ